MPIKYHVLNDLQMVIGDISVCDLRSRIDDAEIHAGIDGMVEENSMHGLADVVVATERETKVANATADMGSFEVLPYPRRSLDEVEGIIIVLFYTCSNRQDIGVKDNVQGIHAHLLR